LVYGHGPTPFLQAARKKQCRCVPGWHMLLYQGAIAFELWTGRKPPVEVMRRALLRAGVEGR
jgi:shikimate dehydrogenase